ncbi:MAG: hypothetical protein NTY04_00180 [Candidatus Staskawiczbacteria bacterium]|nr:hypothetical protein [Candidatus Staskawiczbacteria bacterium]
MREGLVYQPSKEEYLVVLDEDMLKKYWSENGETIKSILREDDNKIIRTKSYVASYSEHIETLFSFLDKEFK